MSPSYRGKGLLWFRGLVAVPEVRNFQRLRVDYLNVECLSEVYTPVVDVFKPVEG